MGSAEAFIARKKPADEAGFLRRYTTQIVMAGGTIQSVFVSPDCFFANASRNDEKAHRPEAMPPKLLRIQFMTKRGSGLGVV